jgi:hypothetical protein
MGRKRSREWLALHQGQSTRKPEFELGEPENPNVMREILQVVENQRRDRTPPEVQETFERLLAEGYSEDETLRLISVVLLWEMKAMMREQRTFDPKRYVFGLKHLPELPES